MTNTDYLDAETALTRAQSELVVVLADLDFQWLSYLLATGTDLLEEGVL